MIEEKSQEKKGESKSEPLWLLIGAVAFVICVFVRYSFWVEQHIPDGTDVEKARAARGQFGDMYGAVNALFSSLAFAVLIYTMWLQRKELRLQREELAETREEMKLARGEAKRQADTATRTALIGALTALWEHHNSASQRSSEDETHQAIKRELSVMMEHLLREVARTNAVELRDETQLRKEIENAHERCQALLLALQENKNAHAEAFYFIRELRAFVAVLALNLEEGSGASKSFRQFKELVTDRQGNREEEIKRLQDLAQLLLRLKDEPFRSSSNPAV